MLGCSKLHLGKLSNCWRLVHCRIEGGSCSEGNICRVRRRKHYLLLGLIVWSHATIRQRCSLLPRISHKRQALQSDKTWKELKQQFSKEAIRKSYLKLSIEIHSKGEEKNKHNAEYWQIGTFYQEDEQYCHLPRHEGYKIFQSSWFARSIELFNRSWSIFVGQALPQKRFFSENCGY